MKNADMRVETLVDAALSQALVDPTEAECFAYEAGRYAWESDTATPERLNPHPMLAEAFAQGKTEVQKWYETATGINSCVDPRS